MNRIFIFTNFYPFGITSENAFLRNELEKIYNTFDEVIIIPTQQKKSTENYSGKYQIDESLLHDRSRQLFFSIYVLFQQEIILELFYLFKKRDIKKIKRLWWSVLTVEKIWFWSKRYKITESDYFYTYWFTDITAGLALLKKKRKIRYLISRAHGYDLYENRSTLHYFPLRKFTLSAIDKLFLISEHGMRYIKSKYPKYSDKYFLSMLGVKIPEIENPKNFFNSNINIVSCSYIKPVKRVDLLCDGIMRFCRDHPELSIVWNHFGDGDNKATSIINDKLKKTPGNCEIIFHGNVENIRILNFYKNNHVDFFISVSSSEGIPVSIIEAMSFGIPVIATPVGGVPELVKIENGYLLKENPTPNEISNIIWGAINDHESWENKSKNSRKQIKTNFNSEKNYNNFIVEIKNINSSH